MTNPELDEALREPLDDEERVLMNPDTWDWENAQEAIVDSDAHPLPKFAFRMMSFRASSRRPSRKA